MNWIKLSSKSTPVGLSKTSHSISAFLRLCLVSTEALFVIRDTCLWNFSILHNSSPYLFCEYTEKTFALRRFIVLTPTLVKWILFTMPSMLKFLSDEWLELFYICLTDLKTLNINFESTRAPTIHHPHPHPLL